MTETDRTGQGRIVLLTTTHRVAPGLLSWAAWRTLRDADLVLCRDAAHPQLPYLADAGVAVEHGVPGAAEVVAACAGGRTVVVLAGAEGERALTDGLAALAGSGRAGGLPDLELLPGSYDLPGARLLDLVEVMDRIRAVCPWASERTSTELAKYGVEEMYELVEAVETGDRAGVREELGDVLLQVVFHARIAQDDPDEPFGIDDVAAGIVDKLVRRHPHVFGDETAETAADVKALWLRTKAAEKGRASVTDGVPLGQPALALAAQLSGRAEGIAVPLPQAAPGAEGAFGYRLLALAAEAGAAGVDPETALRAAARTYRDAIRAAER
ncbi:nucleoside triphosphate pyrophosphohydrolase [Streptomyces avicenniae]|uniref:nucleoside triphosphate pyrophosphohydrolase n=1 Tax=Streptomyces avicenniae TaxID=500153 RepID=UPI00069C6A94|nr:nucleoside triphosphate pyrophosphohydrolase [Streptomyces avicenniae]